MPVNDVQTVLSAVHDAAPVPPLDLAALERRAHAIRRRRVVRRSSAVAAAVLVAAAAVVVGTQVSTGDHGGPPVAEDPPTVLTTYADAQGTVSLSTLADRLPGAPAEFRSFVESQLTATWQDDFGGRPQCRDVPQIDVDTLRSDGYALGSVHELAQPGCEAGGGYVAIWSAGDGTWREVVGTQEAIRCAKLRALGIPSDLGVTQCLRGGDLVDYSHP